MVLILKTLFLTYEEALAALLSKILTFITEKVGDQECMKKSLLTAKKALVTLNDAINRNRKNELTEQINNADAFRDSLYRALCLRIDSDMLHLHDPELVQRATLLNNILIENGRTMEKAALEQSNQLESLFTRFDKVIDIVKQNGIETLYNNIKIAEQKFKSLSNAGAENAKNKKEMPWVREALDGVLKAFNEVLFKRLDVEAREAEEAGESAEPFKSVISALNEMIDEAHKIQRARISRNESGTADNGPGNNTNKTDEKKSEEKTSPDNKPEVSETDGKQEDRETELVS